MIKFFQVAAALVYVLLTILAFLLVLALSGIYISYITAIVVITVWLLFCFSAVYFLVPVRLFFHFNLRKPILEEEEKLSRCFREVKQKSGCGIAFRLRIDETSGLNAFAIGLNTIAVGKETLTLLKDDELKGLLAHELGHLVSRDCIASSAFVTASYLPRLVSKICRIPGAGLKAFLAALLRGGILVGAILLVIVCFFLQKWRLIMPMIAVAAFLLFFLILNKVFIFLVLLISRYTEYKQDAYAFRLGYGQALREVLKRIASAGSQQVNPYFILMNGTHPIVYNRIRRLEKLLGWRDHNLGVTGL